ncbi:MAG: TonB-dependent receptor [Planctomycetota bacterium]
MTSISDTTPSRRVRILQSCLSPFRVLAQRPFRVVGSIGLTLCFCSLFVHAEETITPTAKTEEIIVTATRQPKPVKDVPGAVTIITQKNIQSKNTLDLADVFGDTPGIKILRYGSLGTASTLHIRGLRSEHVLVMVDDRIINSPSTGSADLSYLSVDNVDRIEIVRGPYSALYGANAVSGVVNIITKKSPQELTSNISTLYGTYNTSIIQIGNGLSNKNGGLSVWTNYKTSDGYRDNSQHHSMNSSLRWDYQPKPDRGGIIFDAGYYKGETHSPGAQPAPDSAKRTTSQITLGNNDVSSLFDFGDNEKTYFSIFFTLGEIKLRASMNNWDDENHREWIDSGNRIAEDSDFLTTDKTIEIIYNKSLLADHNFTVGAMFESPQFKVNQKDLNTSTMMLTSTKWDSDRTTYSGYLQDEITISKIILTLGGRFDNPNDFNSQFSSRGNVLYQLTPEINIRASSGDSYRAPSLNDIYWPKDDSAEGNPNLKPEKGNTNEIGFDYKTRGGLSTKINLFEQNLKNMITWAPTGTVGPWGNRWTPTNLNQAQIKGVELEELFELTKDTSFTFGYTLLDANQENQELTDAVSNTLKSMTRKLAYTPSNKFDFTASHKNVFSIDKLMFDINVQYVSDAYQYYSDYTAYPTVTTIKKSLASYWLSNLKIRRTMESMEFFLGVDNITDKKYAAQFGSSIDDCNYPMPGRTYNFGLSIRF